MPKKGVLAVCLSVHFPMLFLVSISCWSSFLCVVCCLFRSIIQSGSVCLFCVYELWCFLWEQLVGLEQKVGLTAVLEKNEFGVCWALGSSRRCCIDVVSQSRWLLSFLVCMVGLQQKILVFSKQFAKILIYHSPSAGAMGRVALVFGFRIGVLFNRYPPNRC